MRIAIVSEHASPLATLGGADAGGQNVHVAGLAGALADRGHQVEVYTRRDDPAPPPVVPLRAGVDVVHVPAGPAVPVPKDELLPHMTRFGSWLAARWRAAPPDLVHAHFWMSGVAAMRARRTVPAPVTLTFHALGTVKHRYQGNRDSSPPQRIATEARLARQVDTVIATCADEVRELLAMGVPSSALSVVPCGVDLAAFRPTGPPHDAGSRIPARTRRHRVLSLGRLVERKGVDTMIEALAAVPDAELLVAGGPAADRIGADPDCRRLLATATRHGVRERVRMLGQVDREHAPDLIRSADVVVSVPWYEPFGIVPVEAMACGVPVITSAVGGMLDTVADGVTGLHVPPADPGRLAVALRRLLADPAARAAMGRAAAQQAASRFGWHEVAARTELVYRQLLNRRPLDPRRAVPQPAPLRGTPAAVGGAGVRERVAG